MTVERTDGLRWISRGCNGYVIRDVTIVEYGGFLEWSVSQNGWFTMGNPIEMDDLGVPLFQETSISFCNDNYLICGYGCIMVYPKIGSTPKELLSTGKMLAQASLFSDNPDHGGVFNNTW